MVYRYAIDAPFLEQWAPSSRLPPPDPGLAPGNCGVTCVTMTATYYRDTLFGIYSTRLLGTYDKELSTSIVEQQLMLRRRGVPCHFERMTVATIAARVGTGRWPVMVGMQMSLVPLSVAGHPFRGSHALLLRARVMRNGVWGFLAADPNFSTRTNRRDPTNGRRFYSDALIKRAYWDAGMFALVPDKPKALIAPAPTPLPTPTEAEVDANRFIPIALCKVAAGGTVYADPDRKVTLIASWVGQASVGLYAKPSAVTSKSLAPIRIEVSGKLRVGYVGWDKVSNIR